MIGDIWSNTYSLDSISHTNKIRIASGVLGKGIAWIDAIGCSWNPDYELGDNKIPFLYYPEKCNINFAADLSTDTPSDIKSLRYYWQFGDSTSWYGKYVAHEYKQSGIYNVTLNVKDDNGNVVSSGIYLTRLRSGEKVMTQRILLMK